jgi:hypothetical protein
MVGRGPLAHIPIHHSPFTNPLHLTDDETATAPAHRASPPDRRRATHLKRALPRCMSAARRMPPTGPAASGPRMISLPHLPAPAASICQQHRPSLLGPPPMRVHSQAASTVGMGADDARAKQYGGTDSQLGDEVAATAHGRMRSASPPMHPTRTHASRAGTCLAARKCGSSCGGDRGVGGSAQDLKSALRLDCIETGQTWFRDGNSVVESSP